MQLSGAAALSLPPSLPPVVCVAAAETHAFVDRRSHPQSTHSVYTHHTRGPAARATRSGRLHPTPPALRPAMRSQDPGVETTKIKQTRKKFESLYPAQVETSLPAVVRARSLRESRAAAPRSPSGPRAFSPPTPHGSSSAHTLASRPRRRICRCASSHTHSAEPSVHHARPTRSSSHNTHERHEHVSIKRTTITAMRDPSWHNARSERRACHSTICARSSSCSGDLGASTPCAVRSPPLRSISLLPAVLALSRRCGLSTSRGLACRTRPIRR